MKSRYEYRTVVGDTAQELDYGVNELLNLGWILVGDPYSSSNGVDYYLFQALIREITIDEPVNNK